MMPSPCSYRLPLNRAASERSVGAVSESLRCKCQTRSSPLMFDGFNNISNSLRSCPGFGGCCPRLDNLCSHLIELLFRDERPLRRKQTIGDAELLTRKIVVYEQFG